MHTMLAALRAVEAPASVPPTALERVLTNN
jgi:hypothetical protein